MSSDANEFAPICVSYELAAGDLAQITRFRDPGMKYLPYMVIAGQIVIAIGLIAAYLLLDVSNRPRIIAAIFFVVVLPLPLLYGFEALTLRLRLRKSTQRETTFGKDGISVNSPVGEAKMRWNAFSGYASLPTLILLLAPGGRLVAVPRRAVPPNRESELEALLAARLERLDRLAP